MFLLLSGNTVFRYFLRRRVGQGSPRLLFQTFQFIEARIPLVVGHAFAPSVIVSVRSLVQLPDELFHPNDLVIYHDYSIFTAKL